ncbi:MAG: DNA-processing protein DprA [Chitinispirillales bacterium]|jgi:DNA processing protein|nr:DNA-processing protein DprA [Chitinispirillales bacterium]
MREYWIALNSIDGLGPVRIRRLMEVFGTPQAVFEASAELSLDKRLIPALSREALRRKSELLDAARRQIDECAENRISILILDDEDYPVYLKEIFAPPPILYVKGDLSVFRDHALAIVGTRIPTTYGKNCTRDLTAELSGSAVIVSGLARGVDTVAHESCLDAGGKTIAVLGCGLDRIYPPENKALAKRICENGALVSEFPLGTAPEPYNFPRRNRVISGMSCGVIVIEAGEKSGALITADYALQQNRTVFAVPGPITSAVSAGTFKLIRDGAIPIRSSQDVFEHISAINFAPHITAPPQKIRSEMPPRPALAAEELAVWDALSDTPDRVDTIAETCGLEIPQILGILLNLELKGFITQVGGQMFRRIS